MPTPPPPMRSKCCEAPLETSYGEEGTNCYVCTKCKNPSDPIPPSTSAKATEDTSGSIGNPIDATPTGTYDDLTNSRKPPSSGREAQDMTHKVYAPDPFSPSSGGERFGRDPFHGHVVNSPEAHLENARRIAASQIPASGAEKVGQPPHYEVSDCCSGSVWFSWVGQKWVCRKCEHYCEIRCEDNLLTPSSAEGVGEWEKEVGMIRGHACPIHGLSALVSDDSTDYGEDYWCNSCKGRQWSKGRPSPIEASKWIATIIRSTLAAERSRVEGEWRKKIEAMIKSCSFRVGFYDEPIIFASSASEALLPTPTSQGGNEKKV